MKRIVPFATLLALLMVITSLTYNEIRRPKTPYNESDIGLAYACGAVYELSWRVEALGGDPEVERNYCKEYRLVAEKHGWGAKEASNVR